MLNIKGGLFVDLDSLMDTRFSTLSSIDKDMLSGMIENDSYFTRVYDEFGYINNIMFNDLYSKRNKITLLRSMPTKIIELMATELILSESKQIEANEVPLLTVTINTFPYTLTGEEMNKFTIVIKKLCLNSRITVAYVNLHPKNVTLSFIASNFSVVIMYDYSKWLDYQISLKTGSAETTVLYVPSLMGNAIKVKKDKDLEDMFNAYSELFGPYISLRHIPVESFSIQSQRKKEILKMLKS